MMKIAVISEQGIRPTMEDTHYLDTDFGSKGWIFGGIYDGHYGRLAAEYAAEKLHRIFSDQIFSQVTPGQAFIKAYEMVSNELKFQDSGTTAVNFLIQNRNIFAANAGDARAVVVGKEGIIQLTVDHRLDDPDERQRIENMGGKIKYPYITTIKGGLMPTRTIGDEYFKKVGVIATPSVNEYTIRPDDMMLIAGCDGLFDFISNAEIADYVRKIQEPEKLLEVLKKEVLFVRYGTDNLTIIAVGLSE
jgi:serine/threonine protein phosphatase PrpC